MMRTIYVISNTEYGANEIARMYNSYPELRDHMEEQGYVSDSLHEASRAADRLMMRAPYLSAPVRVWEQTMNMEEK